MFILSAASSQHHTSWHSGLARMPQLWSSWTEISSNDFKMSFLIVSFLIKIVVIDWYGITISSNIDVSPLTHFWTQLLLRSDNLSSSLAKINSLYMLNHPSRIYRNRNWIFGYSNFSLLFIYSRLYDNNVGFWYLYFWLSFLLFKSLSYACHVAVARKWHSVKKITDSRCQTADNRYSPPRPDICKVMKFGYGNDARFEVRLGNSWPLGGDALRNPYSKRAS